MNRLINLLKKYEQFIKFALTGVLNTLISLLVYTLLVKFNVWYMIASVIGYLSGLFNGYILSSKWVFKADVKPNTGVKFISVYISSLLINLCILYILVDVFGSDKILAQLMVTGFNLMYNYTLNKLWTFKKA